MYFRIHFNNASWLTWIFFLYMGHTIGYHRNYCGRWLTQPLCPPLWYFLSYLCATLRDIRFLIEYLSIEKSYLHSWCFQWLSRPISNSFTVLATIISSGKLFQISTTLLVNESYLPFSLHDCFFSFLLWHLVFACVFNSIIPIVAYVS